MIFQFGVENRRLSSAERKTRQEIAARHGAVHHYVRYPVGPRGWFTVEVDSPDPFGRGAAEVVLADLRRTERRAQRRREMSR